MTEILTFKFDNLDFRAIEINGQVWAIGTDVCKALGYRDAEKGLRNLDEDERDTHILGTAGGSQEMLIVNESGLYSLIFRSRKPAAKRFRKWVTSEVLPSIRKTGAYRTSENSPQSGTDNAISQKMFELQTWENELNHRWNSYNLAQNEKLAKQLAEQDMEGRVIVGSADILVRHSSLGDDDISDFITALADSKKYPPEWVAWRRRLAIEGRVKDANPSQMIQH